jgi:predicted component of type VI protein secretion system
MKLSLVVQTPGNKMDGKVLEIKLAQFLVGRDPQCHLRPASALISKRHCALLQRDGKAYVRDFDSTNGTFVNDQPVKGEVELKHNDKLKIGPLLFGVVLETGADVNRPTPPPPTRAPKTQAISAPSINSSTEATAAIQTDPTTTTPTVKSPFTDTPAPATASGRGSDDDIAAMLLSLADDGGGTSGGLGSEVPDGSTVHDLVAPDIAGAKDSADGKAKEDRNAKLNTANTAAAAKSILEKYMRRPRSKS